MGHPSPLISPVSLNARSFQESVFIDVSTLLPNVVADIEGAFRRKHFPNARRLDMASLAARGSDLPHTLPSASCFAKVMGDLGVVREDSVVFYDQSGSVGACRAWWMARLFGHEKCFILDGGLAAVRADQTAFEHDKGPNIVEQRTYRTRAHYALLAGLGDVIESLKRAEHLVLDARGPDRFWGRIAEPRANLRAGHMPGAINLPYTSLLNDNGTFLPAHELRGIFERVGAKDRLITTSCGSGITAATVTVACVLAGLPIGRLFDGSWTEWASELSLPVITHGEQE